MYVWKPLPSPLQKNKRREIETLVYGYIVVYTFKQRRLVELITLAWRAKFHRFSFRFLDIYCVQVNTW